MMIFGTEWGEQLGVWLMKALSVECLPEGSEFVTLLVPLQAHAFSK